jgi:hypothetical protein
VDENKYIGLKWLKERSTALAYILNLKKYNGFWYKEYKQSAVHRPKHTIPITLKIALTLIWVTGL